MTVRRALAIGLAVAVATGFWLNRPVLPRQDAQISKNDKPVAAQPNRRLNRGQPRLGGKIQPVENKIITGVFDRNIVNGRTKFERAVGVDVAVVVIYQSWADKGAFPQGLAARLGQAEKVLMVTWEPWRASKTDWDQPKYRLRTIAAGKHDAYIRKWLLDARDHGRPIFVRFAHEMNGDWYPWGHHVNKPADYVAAWRHIVDMSRKLGATNITWVWSPNEVIGKDRLDVYYPGDDYVDWIGVSGFNWGGVESWQDWRSFSQIFSRTFEQLRRYEKPISIAEISSVENPRAGRQSRAAWITETLAQVKKSDPRVSMIIWFDATFEAGNKLYNWVIDASPASVKAMKDGLSDPAFTSRIAD